jgi:hypothetical protein
VRQPPLWSYHPVTTAGLQFKYPLLITEAGTCASSRDGSNLRASISGVHDDEPIHSWELNFCNGTLNRRKCTAQNRHG